MHTRGAACRAARDAVLLTTELLEHILRHLNPRRLLIAQRVCRKFRAVISESRLLQQQLFLAPAEATSGWLYEAPTNRREHGRSEESPGCWTKISKDALKNRQKLGQIASPARDVNHMLFEQSQWSQKLPDRGPDDVWGIVTLIKEYPPSMRHQEASWRRMYLTQPPTEFVDLLYHGKELSPICRKDGVKVADVIGRGLAITEEHGAPIDWSEFDIDVMDMIAGDRLD